MKYLLIIICVFAFSCDFVVGKQEKGNGTIETKAFNLNDFEEVSVSGSFDVELTQGPEYKVELETDANLTQYIEINKKGKTLVISEQDGFNLRPSKNSKVRVTMPHVYDIAITGSGDIKTTSDFTETEKVDISITGSGDATLGIKAPKVDASITGSGTARVSGSTKDQSISITGSGDYFGQELLSENATVSIGGSGTAKLFASVKLDVSIGGAGDVYYKGSPAISKSIGGSGSVQPLK